MMSYEKGKFSYSFFILLTHADDMNSLPPNWQSFIFFFFFHPSLFERDIIFIESLFNCTYENIYIYIYIYIYETGCIERFS